MFYFPEDVWKIIKYHFFKSYWLQNTGKLLQIYPKLSLIHIYQYVKQTFILAIHLSENFTNYMVNQVTILM